MIPRGEKQSLNMRTVARRAGVSSATVSRVINGSATVREETAELVRRVIKELNFVPNPIATTLKYGRSKTYGVIVPDLTNPFYPEFLLNFEDVLVEKDQELLLANTHSSAPKLINSVRRMLMRQVDGVVLMASEFDTRAVEPLIERRIPIVTIDRRRTQEGSGDVAIDFEEGYRQAVFHLKELGHRKIGFIGGTPGIRTSAIRLAAFRTGLEEAGLTFNPRFVRAADYRVAGGEAAMRSLLKEARLPTAVITANDLSAFGVLNALHASGVRVPEEMSVIGFDGIMLTEAMYPPLTTISVSRRELAQACVQALDHGRENVHKRGLLMSVRCSLLVRGSTGLAPRRGKT